MKTANLIAETFVVICPECREPIPESRTGSHMWTEEDLRAAQAREAGAEPMCVQCGAFVRVPLVDLTPLKNLHGNQWDWNLLEFCQRLGIERDSYAEEKFREFRQIALSLRSFDDNWLRVLCGPKDGGQQ